MSAISTIEQYVYGAENSFQNVLVDKSINFEREAGFAIQILTSGDFIAKLAVGDRQSVVNAVTNIAAIGISLNPAKKQAYLVPRKGKICLDISYMGLLHLAQVSGAIQWGQCKLVHASDTYESNGLDKAPTHRYNAFGDRGSVVGGYCTVKTAQGDYLTEEMSLAEVKQVEASSKAKNGPWQKWWDEMARKTIVKRASKYWPRCERLDNAIDHLNTDGGEGLADPVEQQQETIVNPVEAIKQAIASKGRTEEQFFAWFSSARKLPEPIHSFDVMTDEELQWAARKMEAQR